MSQAQRSLQQRNTNTAVGTQNAQGQFDAQATRIYKLVSENHRHPLGPWATMTDSVWDFATNVAKRNDIHLLDLATGPGEPALSIARRLPESSIIATDVSPDQVALANQAAMTIPNMSAEVANIEDLHQFRDSTFDVVTCCYGFMFATDILKAIEESYRVLKPGGRLIATTWNKLPIVEQAWALLERVLGTLPPQSPANSLALKEPGLFELLVREAGFTDLESSVYEYPFDLTDDSEFQFQAVAIIVKDSLDKVADGWKKARIAYDAIKHDFGEHDCKGHWILPWSQYQLVVVTKPCDEAQHLARQETLK